MLTEGEILRSILDCLEACKILHWRVSLGGVRHGGIRKKNPMTGFPDICGIVPHSHGRMFAIEVKKPKVGRFSNKQKEWQEILERHDALYIVATSVDDLKRLYKETGSD